MNLIPGNTFSFFLHRCAMNEPDSFFCFNEELSGNGFKLYGSIQGVCSVSVVPQTPQNQARKWRYDVLIEGASGDFSEDYVILNLLKLFKKEQEIETKRLAFMDYMRNRHDEL